MNAILNQSAFDRHFTGAPTVHRYKIHFRVHDTDWPEFDRSIRCTPQELADRIAETVASYSPLARAAEYVEITPQAELEGDVAAVDPRWGISRVADYRLSIDIH